MAVAVDEFRHTYLRLCTEQDVEPQDCILNQLIKYVYITIIVYINVYNCVWYTVNLFSFIAILSYFDVFRYAEHNRAHKNPVFAWICRPAASMWALVPFSAKFWPLTTPLLKFFSMTAWYLKKVTDLVLFILFIFCCAIDQLTVTVIIIVGMRVILQGLCANATCRKLDLKVKRVTCRMFQ